VGKRVVRIDVDGLRQVGERGALIAEIFIDRTTIGVGLRVVRVEPDGFGVVREYAFPLIRRSISD
jgi:hypothetical protein